MVGRSGEDTRGDEVCVEGQPENKVKGGGVEVVFVANDIQHW